MMTAVLRTALLAFCLLAPGLSQAASEAPLLHPLFRDHGVLQRDRPVTVWGWAKPGTEVTVRFAEQQPKAIAGPDSRWTCVLNPLAVSAKGQTLTVETNSPGLRAEAKDLLVGDVWLCSGQSNMEMGMTLCAEDEEIATADLPGLRLLTVEHQTAYEPQTHFDGEWKRCNPEALREGGWGGFSATAYFFGKMLHQQLEVPIGLIHSSWGGTVIEAWTSAPALDDFPEFDARLDQVAGIAASTAADPLAEYLDGWFLKHDRGSSAGWQQCHTDTSGWRQVTLPGRWADFGIPRYQGVVWARRQIELPASWAGKRLVVRVGEISDNDTTWLNETVIGRTNQFSAPRRYEVPEGIAKAGPNTIAMRITNTGGGAILAEKHPLCIHPLGDEDAAISLAGPWQLQESASRKEVGTPVVGTPNVPSILSNGMIAPLGPYSMTGVIWYQGEGNASRAQQYRRLLPALIRDWRRQFQRDDLAFHIVSLANYQPPHDQPRDHPWAELREAQAMTAKTVPHCGLAVAIDIGDADDIHPKNKREVGRRLGLSALEKVYGKELDGSGPWFRAAEVEGERLRLHFDYHGGGLHFMGDPSRSFAIAGKDRRFVWAKAEIDGGNIVVSSPEVPDPVAVRYAWDSNPQASLYNGSDLPAVPFRSDDWPGVTKKR